MSCVCITHHRKHIYQQCNPQYKKQQNNKIDITLKCSNLAPGKGKKKWGKETSQGQETKKQPAFMALFSGFKYA